MSQQNLIDLYDAYFPFGQALTDEEKWQQLNKLSGYKLNEYEYIPEYDDVRDIPKTDAQAKLENSINQNNLNMPDKFRDVDEPHFLNNLFSSSLSEWFVESGDPLGLGSTDYYKWVHNNSMAGLWYKYMHGRDEHEYSDKDYEPGVLGHVAGFFLGLGSPLDAASLVVGGGAGKIGARAASKSLLNRWGTESVK